MENKVINGLKGLMNENSTPEFVEQVGNIIKEAEKQQEQLVNLAKTNEDIRNKYIDSIVHGGTPSPEVNVQPKEQSPKTFEDCVNDVIKARK